MANAQAKIEAVKASLICPGADALACAPYMIQYRYCDTTVGQLEECGREQVDIIAALRRVPCSEYSLARRDASSMAHVAAATCAEIEPTCPP